MEKIKGNNIKIKNYLNYDEVEVLYEKVENQKTGTYEGTLTIALQAVDRDKVFDSMYTHCGLSMTHGFVYYSLDRIIKNPEILAELDKVGKVNLQVYNRVTDSIYTGEIVEIVSSGSYKHKIPCPDIRMCPDHLKNKTYTTWLKVRNFLPQQSLDRSKYQKLNPNKYVNFKQLEGKRWDLVYLKNA